MHTEMSCGVASVESNVGIWIAQALRYDSIGLAVYPVLGSRPAVVERQIFQALTTDDRVLAGVPGSGNQGRYESRPHCGIRVVGADIADSLVRMFAEAVFEKANKLRTIGDFRVGAIKHQREPLFVGRSVQFQSTPDSQPISVGISALLETSEAFRAAT